MCEYGSETDRRRGGRRRLRAGEPPQRHARARTRRRRGQVSADPADLDAADGVVLPGVGAFSEGMDNAGPFRDVLAEQAADGKPLFGICLGMQMLLTTSEEAEREGQGDVEGLDLIPGTNVRFAQGQKGAPHGLERTRRPARPPARGGRRWKHAYFVHSYYAEPEDENAVVTTTDYEVEFPPSSPTRPATSSARSSTPEKSGETGLQILRNFVDICADW